MRENKELPKCFCCDREYEEHSNGAFYACSGNEEGKTHSLILISKKYFVSENGSEIGNPQETLSDKEVG